MGCLPGFVRRASLTLGLGSWLASLGEAQMADVFKNKKKKKVSFYFSWSLSLETVPILCYFLSFFLAFQTKRFSQLKKNWSKIFLVQTFISEIDLLWRNRFLLTIFKLMMSWWAWNVFVILPEIWPVLNFWYFFFQVTLWLSVILSHRITTNNYWNSKCWWLNKVVN